MSEKNIFKWIDSLSVGFTEIDLHHKKLLNILNKFKETLELPDAEYKSQIGKIIKNLCDYTEYHFSEEEIIMNLMIYTYKQLEYLKMQNYNLQKMVYFLLYLQEKIQMMFQMMY